MAQLARDKFNLVTAGRFSRGKSTLMNALLNTDLLPTGIIPLTSVITLIKHGSPPHAVLYYRASNLSFTINLEELENYITEQKNPGNKLGLGRAEIELPSAMLRYGFCFVDTPGLGSSIPENNSTTLDFLSEAQALLVVTSFDAALSFEEMDLLRLAQQRNLPAFLAVNKEDLVNARERDDVLYHIKKCLEHEQLNDIKIFPVSAIMGVVHQTGGIAALRHAIIQSCIIAGQQLILADIFEKTKNIMTDADDFLGLEALTSISARIFSESGSAEDIIPKDTIPRKFCPICSVLSQVSFQTISKLQAQLSQDIGFRADFVKNKALCRIHVHQFGKIANPLAVAQSLADSLEAIVASLNHAGHRNASAPCPVCEALQTAETLAIQRQANDEPDETILICLAHLPKLLAILPAEKRDMTRGYVVKQYERLAEDLRRFALKRDAALRSAITADEAHAATDLIKILASPDDTWWEMIHNDTRSSGA